MSRKRKELPLLTSVEITGVAAEGKALARVRLRESDETPIVLFVPYGAPGDVADIKIEKKKHNYAEGRIVNLQKASPLRRDPLCPHFGICGGCKWQHLPYAEQLNNKRQQVEDALSRIAKVSIPEISNVLPSENEWLYRNKMEYTFSNKKWRTRAEINSTEEFKDSNNALGFHIPGAFDKVLHIDECFLQDHFGDKLRKFIYDYAEKENLSFYDIKKNHGLLRTLMIRISSTGQIMVVVVFGEEEKTKIEGLLSSIKDKFPEISSLLYVINRKVNDSIADQEILTYYGLEYIEEVMEDLKFRVNAKSFYQTNSRQALELYKVARSFAGLDSLISNHDRKPIVYDLYTGAGTIANFVARNAQKVVGIEYVEEAIKDAKINSEINKINNTVFFAGDMKDVLNENFIRENGYPDIMIIDPPRAGMHENVIKVILNVQPKIIVYVSCNPSTQARDLALLDSKYKVTKVQPVDMFPQTHHVEDVVKLELKEN